MNLDLNSESDRIAVIGAGPAGLTAAYRVARSGRAVVVFEADEVVGGIARTVVRDDWRFDIGGHRFFTKVSDVEELWFEILPHENWLLRPRTSHILYDGKYFDYPLRALKALRRLGILESIRCLSSYFWAKLRPPKDQSNFEGWVSARFGRRLYGIFFRTYTEKVWGVPATDIQADWAAQRIKSLSLWSAITNAFGFRSSDSKDEITSLIGEFHYPRLGPGMLWERCRTLVEQAGGSVQTESEVVRIDWRRNDGVVAVTTRSSTGNELTWPCSSAISSMPLAQLVEVLEPPPPPDVLEAGRSLRYRDFLVVALVLPEATSFDAQWIYIHSPGVKVGRVQNFGQWSPELVKPGTACFGLEYFVSEGDELWGMSDDELIALASAELEHLELAPGSSVESGYVVRMPKAYPTYDDRYAFNVEVIRCWIESNIANLHPVGRNGMHRYNNQDHSMLTAMLTVENIVDGTTHDVWSVNVDEDYHESSETSSHSSGRDAPILPSRR